MSRSVHTLHRLGAFIVDSLLASSLAIAAGVTFPQVSPILFFCLIMFIQEFVLPLTGHFTVGRFLFRYEIFSADGSPASAGQLLSRLIGKVFGFFTLGAGFFVAFLRSDRSTIHDLISDTSPLPIGSEAVEWWKTALIAPVIGLLFVANFWRPLSQLHFNETLTSVEDRALTPFRAGKFTPVSSYGYSFLIEQGKGFHITLQPILESRPTSTLWLEVCFPRLPNIGLSNRSFPSLEISKIYLGEKELSPSRLPNSLDSIILEEFLSTSEKLCGIRLVRLQEEISTANISRIEASFSLALPLDELDSAQYFLLEGKGIFPSPVT